MAVTGSIVRIVGDRGFGFIRDDLGEELFFHASVVTGVAFDDLRQGDLVSFDTERDPRGKGNRAVNVSLA